MIINTYTILIDSSEAFGTLEFSFTLALITKFKSLFWSMSGLIILEVWRSSRLSHHKVSDKTLLHGLSKFKHILVARTHDAAWTDGLNLRNSISLTIKSAK